MQSRGKVWSTPLESGHLDIRRDIWHDFSCSCRFQTLVTTLVNAAVDDYGVLGYSATSAGAVLDTLALLSSSPEALEAESQAGATLIKVFLSS